MKTSQNVHLRSFDDRRDLLVIDHAQETIDVCVRQFIEIAQTSIKERGLFTVALSGGSTPNAIFKQLSQPQYIGQVDWSKVIVFWSDERSVPPNHPESNFHMAMEAGIAKLPIPPNHIFRMKAENEIEKHAQEYEQAIRQHVPSQIFDLMMLGMGEDGHTASLFPHTKALHVNDHLVAANYVPQKETWRMTLTYKCINSSRHIRLYVLGKNKANMVLQVLTSPYNPDNLPVQKVGTPAHKALWILDKDAAEKI